MSDPLVILQEIDPAGQDPVLAKMLLVEYAESLGFSLCFQQFDEELEGFPGKYSRPEGNFWLARVDDSLAGCIALRPYGDGTAEMKRLYVRPGFRGHRLGTRLTKTVIDYARKAGYSALRLDTEREKMREAQAIYKRLGFVERDPYYEADSIDLVFYEKPLT
ncbi:GNAT family N-acetyltransferase [Rhodospirillaceae bacterium KN72]|uniref:GNAT family N-acetyltransferase n=1 Tax=Pacificispira spongiicola TaxID=2729598 RepID=A0A7Y0HFA5_9PROT|nr:GNAT family N-acetyltransferase [Pacificispira spongiicola]NMM44378.1 GNAT family N-acetyltransferase [Pacificispira spongiicola]